MGTSRPALVIRWLLVALVMALGPVAGAQELLIGGGSVSGLYNDVAKRICAIVNRYSVGKYQCRGRPALGSVFNINAVMNGLLDFGLAQSDRNWQATNGKEEWRGRPVKALRSVFSLHAEAVMLVARRDAAIASVEDLKGKRVNIGNWGSGQRGNAMDVLRLHGMNAARDLRVFELQQHVALRALIDGKIQAFFYTSGNPSEAIRLPAARVAVRMIPLDSEAVLRFVSGKPYYAPLTIPAGLYRGVDRPVRTYGVRATLVASAATPDEVVYDVVRLIFEHLDELRALHPALAELTPNTMLSALTAPLHPGALRYYRERGWVLTGGGDDEQ